MSDPQDSRDPLLLDHNYDGIRELNNKLPRWWVWLFNGTILFAVVYLIYYHVLGAGSVWSGDYNPRALSVKEYDAELKLGTAIKQAAMAQFEAAIPALKPSKDEAVIAEGKEIFLTRCAPCHRKDGGGLVGPNLTDDYWIHGSNYADNVTTIWNGVPAKGMITWKNYLNPKQVQDVASYIYTLRGAKLLEPGKPPENQAPVKTGPSAFE